MQAVVDLAAEAWDEIPPTTIRKSWRKIIPIPAPADLDTDSSQNPNSDEDDAPVSEFTGIFTTMGFQMDGGEISAWLQSDDTDPGFQIFTDDEIYELVMEEVSAEHEQEN